MVGISTSGPFPGSSLVSITVNDPIIMAPSSSLTLTFDFLAASYIPSVGPPFIITMNYQNYCGQAESILSQPTSFTLQNSNCNLSIAGPNVICAGDQVTLTASYLPILGSSCTWTSGSWASTSNSITINPISTTTYTATVGSSSSTYTVVVIPSAQCCIPPDFYSSVNNISLSNRTASDYISMHPGFIALTTNAEILIDGVFTVDQDFSFIDCPNIIMGPGAYIDVLPGINLSVIESHISSCKEMNQGIQARTNSNVYLNWSTIEDAFTGVNMADGSSLDCSNNTRLLNDFIGINIGPFGTITSSTSNVNLSIEETYFDCDRTLVNPFSGQPMSNQTHSFAGIRAINTNFLSVGVGASHLNYFSRLNFGIYNYSSNITIENFRFSDIQKFDATYPFANYLGSAIYCDGSMNGVRQLNVYGDGNESTMEFLNCKTGISGRKFNMDIKSNTFDNCDFGISVRNIMFQTIDIELNKLSCNRIGIGAYNVDYGGVFSIAQNKIIVGQVLPFGLVTAPVKGIDVTGMNSSLSFNSVDKVISTNQIQVKQFGNIGINLNAIDFVTVDDNYIQLSNDVSPTHQMTGVRMSGANSCTISCNGIVGLNTDQSQEYPSEAGLQLSLSKYNTILQNSFNFISNGILAQGACLNATVNPQSNTFISKNTFGSHYNALHYSTSAQMDFQAHSGNQWLANSTSTDALEDNTQRVLLDGLIVDQAPNHVPNNYTFNFVFPIIGSSDPEIYPSDCGDLPTLDGNGIDKIIQIALDTLKSNVFEPEMLIQAQYELYKSLLDYPDTLTNYPDLYSFYLNNSSSAIHFIANVKKNTDLLFADQKNAINIVQTKAFLIYDRSVQLRQLDSLITVNKNDKAIRDSLKLCRDFLAASIKSIVQYNDSLISIINNSIQTGKDVLALMNKLVVSNNDFEINVAKINGIYLSTIETADSLYNYQSQLLTIASQCPISGGPAVYRARTLLQLISPDLFFDDDNNCIQSGLILRSRNYSNFRFYPNPTSGSFSYQYLTSNPLNLCIFDLSGRKVRIFQLNANQTIIKEELKGLENGVYIYQTHDDNGILFDCGKFVKSN